LGGLVSWWSWWKMYGMRMENGSRAVKV